MESYQLEMDTTDIDQEYVFWVLLQCVSYGANRGRNRGPFRPIWDKHPYLGTFGRITLGSLMVIPST